MAHPHTGESTQTQFPQAAVQMQVVIIDMFLMYYWHVWGTAYLWWDDSV